MPTNTRKRSRKPNPLEETLAAVLARVDDLDKRAAAASARTAAVESELRHLRESMRGRPIAVGGGGGGGGTGVVVAGGGIGAPIRDSGQRLLFALRTIAALARSCGLPWGCTPHDVIRGAALASDGSLGSAMFHWSRSIEDGPPVSSWSSGSRVSWTVRLDAISMITTIKVGAAEVYRMDSGMWRWAREHVAVNPHDLAGAARMMTDLQGIT